MIKILVIIWEETSSRSMEVQTEDIYMTKIF